MSDRVQQAINSFGSVLAQHAFEQFLEDFEYLGIDSPIEQLMAVGLLFVMRSRDYYGGYGGWNEIFPIMPDMRLETHLPRWPGGYGIQIYPQFGIGIYQADFFVDFLNERKQRVFGVIECDGHDFHERTKAQAAHDKARDRYFQSLGLIVLRYTGSEIHGDPLGVALSALKIIEERAAYAEIPECV